MPRALICDDDPIFRTMLRRVLELNSWTPVCAAHGEEALAILQQSDSPFDWIVVDLLMPICSGWELIDAVRRNPVHRATRILAVTGLDPNCEDRRKLEMRDARVLTKGADFDPTAFLAILNSEPRLISGQEEALC